MWGERGRWVGITEGGGEGREREEERRGEEIVPEMSASRHAPWNTEEDTDSISPCGLLVR